MNLKGKKVLITGGSSGIGKAMANLAKEKGAEVLITGRDGTKLEEVAEELGVFSVQANVANESDIANTFDWIETNWAGDLDVLINNAGYGYMNSLEDLEWSDFENIYSVNVFGAAMMAKNAAAIFRKKKSGSIVNVASTAALKGYPTGTVYSSSKFALRGMTQCWQAELRPHNVRVILINPSEVTTAFAQENRIERPEKNNKLRGMEIAHATISALEMDDRGFIPELTVWATNPF